MPERRYFLQDCQSLPIRTIYFLFSNSQSFSWTTGLTIGYLIQAQSDMTCLLGNVIWDYYWPYVLPPYRYGILLGLLVEVVIVYKYTSSSSTFFHRTVIANVTSWMLGGLTVSLLPLPRRNLIGEYHGNDMIAAYAIAIVLSILFEAVVYWKIFSINRPWTVSTMANLASYLVIILVERPFSVYGEE